jgi:hypothetical protein
LVGASSSSSSSGSPDHVSHAFAPEHRARYPAGYPRRPREGRDHRVPVSRCLSAAGVRFLVILCPPGSWALLAVGLPDPGSGPRRGYRVPHAQDETGEGALYSPGTVVLFQTDHDHRLAPGVSQRRVPVPRHSLHPCAALLDEPSTRVQAIRPSDLPLARDRRMDRQPSGFPPSFAPRNYSQRTSGRGRIIEHGSETSATA